MIEKVEILAEMKRAGMDIESYMQKMYEKYGKENFEIAIIINGRAKLFGIDVSKYM